MEKDLPSGVAKVKVTALGVTLYEHGSHNICAGVVGLCPLKGTFPFTDMDFTLPGDEDAWYVQYGNGAEVKVKAEMDFDGNL
jgi:hypothetical protein